MTLRPLSLEVIDTGIGPISLLEGPRGLSLIEFGRVSKARLAEAVRRHGREARVEAAAGLAAARQVAEYLDGRRREFDVAIDWQLAPEFQRRVLRRLARVPFGVLTSYGELARAVGSPKASRAVGGAMRSNRWPIIVPCHRVVAGDGSLGGFSAGLALKRALLALEGIVEA